MFCNLPGQGAGRLAFFLLCVAPLAAFAQNPTINDETSQLEWSAGPFVVPNFSPQTGGEPICLEFEVTCHEYFFDVNQDPAGIDPDNDFMTIAVGWPSTDADFDPYLYDAVTGELLVNGAGGNNPDVMFVPLRADGTFNGKYRVVVVPFLPIAETYTGRVVYEKLKANVAGKAESVAGATPFDVFTPPSPFTGYSADEPTMGVDRNTNKVYMIYNSEYLETAFDDTTSPATTVWNDVTGNGRPSVQFDPFLSDDEHRLPDGSWSSRIWGVGFGLAASDIRFSDEPSTGVWERTVSAVAGLPAGVDNESVASGPYPDNDIGNLWMERSLATGGKGHAFYYVAHGAVNAFAIRSDDGGATWNTGRPIFPTSLSCSNHGHVKVGADGTVYVPMNLPCQGGQGVSVSLDAGETWTYIRVDAPEAAGGGRWDSSIGIANDGKTIYYGFGHALTDEPYIIKGTLKKVADATALSGFRPEIEWGEAVNVGRPAGLRNMVFSTVVAGDPDRAAFAFHGSTKRGDSGDPNFTGLWYLYVALTYDGGQTWELNNVQPDNPTQRGGICDRGINCPSSPPYRNLLDFMDAVIDRDGRVIVGHADGCIRNCVTPTGKPTYSDQGALARQAGGLPMFAANDAQFAGNKNLDGSYSGIVPLAPVITATPLHNAVHLAWKAPYDGGKPVLGYNVLRNGAPLTTLSGGNINGKPYFIDRGVTPDVTYTYQIEAFNAVGTGVLSRPVTASVAIAPDLSSGTVGDDDKPTVRNQPRAEEAESECVPPGITVVEDGTGDPLTGPPETLDPSEDIEWIAVSEPGALTNRIVFTLKVTSLNEPLLPQHRWVVYFTVPDGTEWYAAMSNADGALRYEYGKAHVFDNPAAPVGQFEYVGDLDPTSGHTADGQITLVLDKAAVGGLNPGNDVDFIYAKVRDSSVNEGTSNSGITRDDTGNGFYTVVGNESCQGKDLPVAAFTASQLTGTAPVTIHFDAAQTAADSGVSVAKYVWSFGDGSDTLETTSPRVSHTYSEAEAYRVKLHVIDSLGRKSNHAKLMVLLGEKSGDVTAGEGNSIIVGGFGWPALLVLAGLGVLGLRRRAVRG